MKNLILIIALFSVTVINAQNVRVNVNDKYLQTISTPGLQSRPPVPDPYGGAWDRPLNLPECLSEEETDIHVYLCPIYDTGGRNVTLLYAFSEKEGRWELYTSLLNTRIVHVTLWSTVQLVNKAEAEKLNREIDYED